MKQKFEAQEGFNVPSDTPVMPKPRKGSIYVIDKMAVIKDPVRNTKEFSNKPMYEGHYPSTHLMADDNKKTAIPTLFQDESGNFYRGGYKEAKRKGEVYKFKSREDMINFARKGNWKGTPKVPYSKKPTFK